MLSQTRRVFVILLSCLVIALAVKPECVFGQDTTIFIAFQDRPIYLGQTVSIPLWIANYTHPIAGYSVLFAFDRPGLLVFDAGTVSDSAGTLTSGWEYFEEITYSPQSARITSIADLNLNGQPGPIPSLTLGETLVFVRARVPCNADTISGTVAHLEIEGLAEFSDPQGNLILPVSATRGTLTLTDPLPGDLDYSGALDVIDVVQAVGCAFRGSCPTACGSSPADLDCSGAVDVVDVVAMVGYVFRGAALPVCP
ncbi:MAG TPA: hypothetical protein VNN55_02810 [bacterium]|nr:hypothetical protein [bacterium]